PSSLQQLAGLRLTRRPRWLVRGVEGNVVAHRPSLETADVDPAASTTGHALLGSGPTGCVALRALFPILDTDRSADEAAAAAAFIVGVHPRKAPMTLG